jgi:hypothetical protein
MIRWFSPLLSAALLLGGCSGSPSSPDAGADMSVWTGYDPLAVTPASMLSAPRGIELHRAVVHLHSVYSWDACDQLGFVDDSGAQDYVHGKVNEGCYDDIRKGLCETGYEVAFLTDHVDHFPDFEFPDVLLYRADHGDELVMKNGKPAAVRLACPDGHKVLLQAGCDYSALAVGLEDHVAATPTDRRAIYGTKTDTAFTTLRSHGALVLAGYLPRWDIADLLALHFDALESYNPIFNFQDRIGDAFGLVTKLNTDPGAVPIPEIGLIAIFQENTTILTDWSQMVQMARVPNFVGSNAHENVLPQPTPDGERLDSYRRMLHWWSNYLQLPSGTVVDADNAKMALAAGRSFAAFDYLGYPTGFDFHAESGGKIYEMGDTVPAGTTDLVVVAPTVSGLTSVDTPPEITVRIVKAEGMGWTEIAKGMGTVKASAVAPGPYRAEVLIVPNHLTPFLGRTPEKYLTQHLWIYGNSIWVQ